MIPVTQFILDNSDPLLYPSEKMTNSIDEQIAFLQSQKQAINEAMLQLMLNIMIMLNCLKNGLVVI